MTEWPTRHLGELVAFEKGKRASEILTEPCAANVRYLQIEDLRPGTALKYCKPFPCPRATKSDVVIAWDGANAGTVSCNLEGYIGSTLALIRPLQSETLSAEYLARYLQKNFDYLRRTATGATVPHISKDALSALQIPLPPMMEQERIVRLLDAADGLRKLRALADQRTAQLIPALFHDMFGDPATNPMKWPVRAVEELTKSGRSSVTTGPFGTQLGSKDFTEDGPEVFGIYSIGPSNHFRFGSSKRVSMTKYEDLKRYSVEANDVLISRMGTVGKVCVVPEQAPKGIVSYHLIRVRLDPAECNPHFFTSLLSINGQTARGLAGQGAGAIMQGINAKKVAVFPVPVPPLELQEEFEMQANQVRELETGQAACRRHLDDVFQSMLHRAVAGVL